MNSATIIASITGRTTSPKSLAQALPHGIDGLFENVGGTPFAASIRHLNVFARVAVCGLVASGYDGTPTPLPDMRLLLDKRASMQGFIITDHLELWPNAISELADHVRSGRLRWRESIAVKDWKPHPRLSSRC